MSRKSAVVDYDITAANATYIQIHYNNGVTEYNGELDRVITSRIMNLRWQI